MDKPNASEEAPMQVEQPAAAPAQEKAAKDNEPSAMVVESKAAEEESAAQKLATDDALVSSLAAPSTEVLKMDSVKEEPAAAPKPTEPKPEPAKVANEKHAPAYVPQAQFRACSKEDATKYLELVRTKFADNLSVYEDFLEIMKDFRDSAAPTPEVIQRVRDLFKGYPDLIQGFSAFLPPGMGMSDDAVDPDKDLRQTVEFDHAITYVNKIKARFVRTPEVYKQFLEILHRYQFEQDQSPGPHSTTIVDVYDQVATLFADHQDLLEEFTRFLPEPIQRSTPSLTAAARPRARAKPELLKPTAPSVSAVVPRVAKKPKPVRPKKEAPPAPEYIFFQTLRTKLSNEAVFRDFIKCVHLYNVGVLSNIDTYVLVHDIVAPFDDVHEDFRTLFSIPNNFPYEFDASTFQVPEMQDIKTTPVAEDSLVMAGVAPMPSQIDTGGGKIMASSYDVLTSPTVRPATGRALIVGADVDYNACKRYGPSYRVLPKHYQLPKCSGRTELAKSVLNDVLVSVPTGTEGEEGGYKSHKKNSYEEVIFKCEDERFELDMLIHICASTLRVLEPIAKKAHTAGAEEQTTLPLQAHHYRIIERIYGDHGKEVVRELKKNPMAVMEIVLKRLREKDAEWRKNQRDWNLQWREMDRHNYYRALDVLSFHFKSRDRKALTPKAIIQELDAILTRETKMAPRRSPPKYQVKTRMDDDSLLTDMVGLLTLAAERTLTARGERDKALRFVSMFLNQLIRSATDTAKPNGEESEASADKTKEGKARSTATRSRVMFTNSAICVYARMFQILYERMHEARALCTAAEAKRRKAVAASGGDPSKMPLLDPRIPIVVQGPVVQPILLSPESGMPIAGVAHVKGMDSDSGRTPSQLPATPHPESFAPSPRDGDETSGQQPAYPTPTPFVAPTSQVSMTSLPPPFAQGAQPGPLYRAFLPPISVEVTEEDLADVYKTTLDQVRSMITSAHDMQRIEDKLRYLLGPNSYVLFGMDRLLQLVVKQALACAVTELPKKLIGLYVYNQSLPEVPPEHAYRANVLRLLPDDEACFRLEVCATLGEKNNKVVEMMRVLYVGMVDTSVPHTIDPRSMEERWATYVDQYLQSDSVLIDPKTHHVFLMRSLKRTVAPAGLEDSHTVKRMHIEPEVDTIEQSRDLIYHTGLEGKICMATYKMFYVQGTEDFMYRKLKSSAKARLDMVKDKRKAKFLAFVNRSKV